MTQARESGVGRVWIVGAGPGDPGLNTVAGLAAVRAADVVLFDRLSSRELLDECRADALRIDVGKAVGDAATQERIHVLLVEHARAGRRVVRLHGGDAFVFGRGAEELAALSAAGVPATVIPGVTSAVAAAEAAGIPVTARGVAASFAVVTGREAAGAMARVDWDRLALAADTLVVLMGVERLAAIADAIAGGGREASTPCAVVEAATTSRQRVVRGTLGTIATAAAAAGVGPPAVLVVGAVVAVGEQLGALRGGLAGRRMLVTRAVGQAAGLAAALRAEGALPVLAPALRIEAAWDAHAIAVALARLRGDAYAWLAFASEQGVEHWWEALAACELDTRALAGVRVCAIGRTTAYALAQRGVRADLLPDEGSAAGVAAALLAACERGASVLLPGAAEQRPELGALLRAGGASVEELAVYRTLVATEADAALLAEARTGLDAVTFASPSAVRGLVGLLGGDVGALRGALIACIGPTTAEAAREAGLAADVVAAEPSVEGLVAALRDAFSARGAGAEPEFVQSLRAEAGGTR
ncbi:MAG: uroporphyrinogen-III C-methyltransferase [Chloroflexi bacterium]|nr:uroporphyrinogen-III C-methyltransferase [Chloroflexota bacterium]